MGAFLLLDLWLAEHVSNNTSFPSYLFQFLSDLSPALSTDSVQFLQQQASHAVHTITFQTYGCGFKKV